MAVAAGCAGQSVLVQVELLGELVVFAVLLELFL